tara:strand:+ start:54 stop:497 length:444 start_codon:yes stop_codon:yes gene_type:complete
MGASRRGSGLSTGTRAAAGLGTTGGSTIPGIPTPGSDIASAIPSLSKPPGVGLGLSGQEALGINSIQEPFGGLGSKRGAPAFDEGGIGLQDVDKPATRVGLTPGSLSTDEEGEVTAPSYDDASEEDKEKRQNAVAKANDFKVSIGSL